jgi:hypothetical protein
MAASVEALEMGGNAEIESWRVMALREATAFEQWPRHLSEVTEVQVSVERSAMTAESLSARKQLGILA